MHVLYTLGRHGVQLARKELLAPCADVQMCMQIALQGSRIKRALQNMIRCVLLAIIIASGQVVSRAPSPVASADSCAHTGYHHH